MENSFIMDAQKTLCIVQLVNALPALRASLNLSQEDTAIRIGVSRQTYNAIESKRRIPTWNLCIALIMLFTSNEATRQILEKKNGVLDILSGILVV